MRVLSLCFALSLAACKPTGITVDGRSVPDLPTAAEQARVDSVIQLEPGDYLGDIELPDGVSVIGGPGVTITGEDRVLSGLGDLTLDGLTLVGGTALDGSSLRVAGDLVMTGVHATGGEGDVAIRALGSVDGTAITVEHPTSALRVLTPWGRPDHVALTDAVLAGFLDVPADFLDLVNVQNDGRVSSFGHNFLVRDSQLDVVELTGPVIFIAHSALTHAHLDARETSLLGLSGTTIEVNTELLSGQRVFADALRGSAEQTDLLESFVANLVLEGQSAEIDDLTANAVVLDVTYNRVHDVRATHLEAAGAGPIDTIILDGPSPTLRLGPSVAQVIAVRSTGGPAQMHLEGTTIRGMVVTEPDVAFDVTSVTTTSFANISNLTWHGGGASSLAYGDYPVFFHHSIVSRASIDPTIQPRFSDSVMWHPDGVTGFPDGAVIADPQFVGPTDPHMTPASPYRHLGAFAGHTASFVEALWNQLP